MICADLLETVGHDLQKRALVKRYIVVADDYVAGLFGDSLMNSLKAADLSADIITFPRGEANKNLTTVAQLASDLAKLMVDRQDGLIALGGGVTGDITGFLAATYMRGIPFVQLPTTLLAQVDSSVGGKTGVDIPEGKNMVGVFYQPAAVYIDSMVLIDLPVRELLNGIAEVIKYSMIYDADFFEFLSENIQGVLARELPLLEEIIYRCCTIKAEVVAKDERESGLRRILNFGHTVGHAVEAASNFTIDHGLAVGMGMVAAAELAVGKAVLPKADAVRLQQLIADYGLLTTIPPELDRNLIKQYLKRDKKAVAGRPFFVLPTAIGQVIITDDVSEQLIDQALS